jgi:hypothetical protein
MGGTCAYCEQERPLTKEHVFPSCLLERSPNIDAAVIDRAPGQFVSPHHTVGDVCKTCNNDHLGDLDAYICEMYDQYFDSYILPGKRVNFEYDFDTLARWLLKTAYNSARASLGDEHTGRLAQHADFMIGTGKRPKNLALFLILVAPYRVTGDEPPGVEELKAEEFLEEDGQKYLQPRWMGANDLTFNDTKMDDVTPYLVVINSFYFVVCLFQQNRFRAKQAHKLLLDQKGVQALPKNRGHADLDPPVMDFIEAVKLFGMMD